MSRRSTNTVIKDMQMEINSMFENYGMAPEIRLLITSEQNSMIIAFMYTFNTFITPDKLLNTLIYLYDKYSGSRLILLQIRKSSFL